MSRTVGDSATSSSDPNEAVAIRLVEWNVAMALHGDNGKKATLLSTLNPTVAILPEAAHPDLTGPALEAVGGRTPQWIGNNKNKGLLAVAFHGWTLRMDESYDDGYQWVMPLHLTGPRSVRLLAVWDMGPRSKRYEAAKELGACRASMDHYTEFLSGDADLTLISGDFNQSVHWDRPSKLIKFGDFMDQLAALGFVSAYHHSHKGCEPGKEPDHTLWHTWNADKRYHIDYTFVRPSSAIRRVDVGPADKWLAYSDHSPMTVDLQI